MEKTDRELLIKEISARLPYGVKAMEESEDERIRKEIVDFICWATDRGSITREQREKSNSWLAWLEKQSKKVEPIESFNSEFERQISQLIASIINKEHEYTEAFVKWTSDALLNYAKHEIEKQGEKTPVIDFKAKDWYVSKVDGKIHNMTYDTANKTEPKFKIKYAGNEYNVLEVKDIAGVSFYGIEDEPNHIDYVKAENCEIISGYAIKENGSAYPTNPAEWSEENETILNQVITNYESGYLPSVVERDEIVKKLKSLKERVQPKQEWSEEDKEYIEACIEVINNFYILSGELKKLTKIDAFRREYAEKLKSWLKSIRPQNRWKPSKEQIMALKWTLNNIPYCGYREEISGLLDQIKKL